MTNEELLAALVAGIQSGAISVVDLAMEAETKLEELGGEGNTLWARIKATGKLTVLTTLQLQTTDGDESK